MSKIKYNTSKTYLLPLISEVIDLDLKFIDYLENTYMFDSNNEYEDCIFLHHKFDFKNPEFTAYEHKLTNNKLFVKHVDIGDKVVYIFKFPYEYLPEYYYLKDSEYSKFGKDAKELILRFWTELYGKVPVGIKLILKIKQILYKDSQLKKEIEQRLSSDKHKVILDDDSELGEHVNINDETINLSE